jgi:hypothetical protein
MPFLGIIWNYKFIETAVQKVTTRLWRADTVLSPNSLVQTMDYGTVCTANIGPSG